MGTASATRVLAVATAEGASDLKWPLECDITHDAGRRDLDGNFTRFKEELKCFKCVKQ